MANITGKQSSCKVGAAIKLARNAGKRSTLLRPKIFLKAIDKISINIFK